MDARPSRLRSRSSARSSAESQTCRIRWRFLRVREILIVAGEPSGDANAAAVARALREATTDFRLAGVGGDQMREAGVELMTHISKLAVMGFVGVLKQIPRHWGLLH